ncbi:MAG: hypothetical protein JXR76_31505 [Deltaproteobacteria bacterium]|nr:hypothetical protein [Deltaproteobacteria bacterium]
MKQDEKILAQYYDGELNERKSAEVKKQLDSSHEGALALENMTKISQLFQVLHEQSQESTSFEGFDKRVINAIRSQKTPVPFSEKLRVWATEFFAHRKLVWIPAASVAGAACVAVLAVGLQNSKQMIPTMPDRTDSSTWQASGTTDSIVSTVAVTAPSEMNVEEFSLETDNGQRIAVVWIDE